MFYRIYPLVDRVDVSFSNVQYKVMAPLIFVGFDPNRNMKFGAHLVNKGNSVVNKLLKVCRVLKILPEEHTGATESLVARKCAII